MSAVVVSLAEYRARRDRPDIERPSLADIHREIATLRRDDPHRLALLRQAARMIAEAQARMPFPGGDAA
jgi:hypothetical protein